MKPLLPLALVIASGFLHGCPDTKIPKAPPNIPEPKASLLTDMPLPALAVKALAGAT